MRSTNYAQEVIRRFLAPAIIKLGGLVPFQKKIESYDDYSLRCLELLASLLSAGGGGGTTPGALTVTTATIVDGAITGVKIQAGSIATGNIADAAITTDKIADGSIQTVDLADAAIVTAKIVDGAITSAKILDGAITTVDLGTAAVTTAKLADGNVTTAKIADAAITSDKIADGAIATIDLADGSITSAKILDGTILAIDIADGVITAAKLAAGAVGTASIPNDAVTTAKILDAAITAAKLATNAVNTTVIVDAAVTTGKIANDAITSAKIQDGAVGTADLADGAITAAKLAGTAAVLSLNTLKGNLILAAGSNVAIATAGSTLTLNASTAVSSLTAPTNPYPGQVWFNIAGLTVSGVPSGNHGVWNGTAWIGVGSPQPQGSLLTLISSPSSPLPGQAWQNISGGTLSGIPSGNAGVWNGSAWVNTLYVPSTVTTSSSAITGFLAVLPSVAVPVGPSKQILLPVSKIFDTFGAFDIATGIYTIPASQPGTWLWEFGCHITNNSADLSIGIVTKNTTTHTAADFIGASVYVALGAKPIEVVGGDLIRFWGNGGIAHTFTAGGRVYGKQIMRIS